MSRWFKEKGENPLITFTREEVERYRRGEISRLSIISELTEKFGYKETTVESYLNRSGLKRERRLAVREHQAENLVPSKDYAWLLGVLATRGKVNYSHGRGVVSLSSPDENYLQKFEETGGRLFKLRGVRSEWRRKDGYMIKTENFYGPVIPQTIGKLQRETWPKIIESKHGWILKSPDYCWKFIEGVFENIGGSLQKNYILFSITKPESANALLDILLRAGVERPRLSHWKGRREGVNGIIVSWRPDVKLIANEITSVRPNKEAFLEHCRKLPDRLTFHRPASDEELLKDWEKAVNILRKRPTEKAIDGLRRQNVILFSSTTYANHLGDGSFVKARAKIEGLLGKSINTPVEKKETR